MYTYIKRAIDIIFSLILLLLFLPLFLFIIVMLKIKKVDKVLFIQKRSGINNSVFNIYKFTTITDSKKSDKFLKFLRKTGLDELPQLINIFNGDMSFVGPRPWILEYSKNFTKKQKKRLNVLPGLTGYAQVSECKDIFDKIEKDCYYVDHMSFWMDFKIILSTIGLIFSNSKNEITEVGITQEIELLKKQKK